ncbi:hypothetical protein H0H81_011524 [Sphagnurus paluster]|uniref:Transketolase-like C-terminal domain-containing protein n=1 Tax=Sphagnurus paluster TaxID=117069 RepID=A0A9P7FNB7_9AGAR|nr:hypothetical protein H0H81_011524 [Sphagnurus paluster]
MQPQAYRRAVLRGSSKGKEPLVVAIEAWGSYGWARYAHASLSMHTFGLSAPADTLYELFGFGVDGIVEKVGAFVQRRREREGRGEGVGGVGDFEELLLGYAKVHAGPRVTPVLE